MITLTCVVVTYNPDLVYFRQVLRKILANNVRVIVVDNGSSNCEQLEQCLTKGAVIFHPLGRNLGIAKAQNIGIEMAFSEGATHVWLSDQDTLYPEFFRDQMTSIVRELEHRGVRYGAIGPSFYELNRQRIEAFVRFAPYGKRFQPKSGLNSVAHLIASGMVIPKFAYEAVGQKRDDFFIDWVDLEWCWRANKMGYPIFGTGDVVIEHNLGEEMVELGNKHISIRSPFRHYFIIRNGLYLCLHDRLLPFSARLHYFMLTLATSVAYPMLAKTEKLQHLKVNLLGLWHGLIGRLGPKP